MPVLVHREGRLAAVAGSMGGAAQPQINAQNLIRAFDLGWAPARRSPRPAGRCGGMSPEGDVPSVDRGGRAFRPTAVRHSRVAELSGRSVGDVDEAVGHAHLILTRARTGFDVGSDPRADGGALAL